MSVVQRLKLLRRSNAGTGKVIAIPETFGELISIASQHFQCEVTGICLEDGSDVSSIDLLRDNDTVFISEETSNHVSANNSTENLENSLKEEDVSQSEWITLNVGGKIYTTTRNTLSKYRDSMLAKMFDKERNWGNAVDKDGNYLIDRSPEYFEPLLNYLRNGVLILNEGVNPKGVLEEAKFFGLKQIVEELEATVKLNEKVDSCITRAEFMRILMATSTKDILRCQGVNLSGADLSYLDLRTINFKHANLSGANLTGATMDYCQLFLADLTNACLDDASLEGVQMKRANLEGASLKSCKFEASSNINTTANLEGAILRNATLEGSQMSNVNLRLAILKDANMQNCVLRDAVLAGADLENCNMKGADLQGANLRGANLIGTSFLDIVAPLHMWHLM